MDYLNRLSRSRNAPYVAGWTRRLSISYRADHSTLDSDGGDQQQARSEEDDNGDLGASDRERGAPVSASRAIKVLYLLSNLTHLRVQADDEFRVLESAIRRRRDGRKALLARVSTVRLVGGTLRFDRLVELIRQSPKLRDLQVEGAFEADRDDEDDSFGGDGDGTRTLGCDNEHAMANLHRGDEDSGAGNPPTSVVAFFTYPSSLDRCASPVPAPPRSIPAFPRLDHLTRLRLDGPFLSDRHLLSIVGAVQHSLESFALVNATCFSREGLVIALRNLRNLFELELVNSTFHHWHSSPLRHLFSDSDSQHATATDFGPLWTRSLKLPEPTSSSTDQLDPYLNHGFCETFAITTLELRNPVDYLPLYCPFLRTLVLTCNPSISNGLVSTLFFTKAVLKLPLQYLTIGVTAGRQLGGGTGPFPVAGGNSRLFTKDLVAETIANLRGRLEALAVTKEYAPIRPQSSKPSSRGPR